ncbi:MAG: tetratricopeptide repeat protein [Cyanobacteria bacterium HKST-UBA02]|nr:tetratricopeptide repeat protein [Cyanobacteria bacterium HKST-UBA02]
MTKRNQLSLGISSSLLALALSIVIGAGSDCPARAPQDPDLALAERLFDHGHYGKAANYYTKFLKKHPTNALVIGKRAKCYNRCGSDELAVKELDKALRIDPNLFWGYKWRGETNFNLGRFKDALADFERARRLPHGKEQYSLARWMGQTYDALGQEQKAFDELARSIREHAAVKEDSPSWRENQQDLYRIRGQTLFNHKRYDEAVHDLSEAIKVGSPGSFSEEITMNRADCYMALKKYDEAIADYSTLLKFSPEDEVAFEKRAHAYEGKGEHKRALADISKAISNYLGEDRSKLYRFRASIHAKLGNKERAQQDLARAAKKPSF